MEESDEFPTQDEIKALDNIFDACDLCDKFHVPYDGLETLPELQERLRLENRRRSGISIKQQIQNAMQRTWEEDQKKRRRLTEMFRELIQIVGEENDVSKVELINDLLKKEHTSDNIQDDCNDVMERLQHNDCVILVAGESSAGKSSFLNLLLGKNYLPTHACSCTSTITIIRYGPKAYAKIIYGDPEPKEVIVEGIDEAGMPPLFDVIFMKGPDRDKGHDIKEVQVFLPSEFLKCGIVLADTPGIGENEFLEQYLMDYISQNQILGFVYIIMSDSAGGVSEDRLLMLLKMIITQQKSNNKALPFDPKAALFLANRFDAIPEEGRKKVRDHILSQLEKSWPEFNDSMAVFFSTKKALDDIKAHPDYVNDQYKLLLERMSDLFTEAMDRRVRSSYRWMETVLKRINHFLKTAVTRIGWSQRDNSEKSAKQRLKLQLLQQHSVSVFEELKLEIEERCQEIVKDVREYLDTPQAQYLLCSSWKADEIPKVEGKIEDPIHWEWVKQRIDEAFYDRLCNAVEDFDDQHCRVSSIEEEIVEHIKSRLGILNEEITEVEADISCTKVSNGSNGSVRYSTSRRLSVSLTSESVVEFPIQLALKLQHRISKNPIRRLISKDSKEYQNDPQQWAKERAKKLLKKLIKNKKKKDQSQGILTLLVEHLMQRPRDVLDKVKAKVPVIIETNLALLQTIEDHLVNASRDFAQYEHTMFKIEQLKQSMMTYGDGYIFVHDFKTNEIKVLQSAPAGGSIAETFRCIDLVLGDSSKKSKQNAVVQGLWTIVRQGMLQRDDQEKHISVKVYTLSSRVTQTFQEIAKLRCLLHEEVFVAKFLGIHHTEAVAPAYIFDGHFFTVECFFLSCSNPAQHYARVFMQTAEGLQYLHSKGLVHMELTTSTVTVTDKGEVRLTGAGLPRIAALPLDPEQPVSDFVYLAPEVLNEELYITSADVYGFGLMVYEITGQMKAFKNQRSFSFKEFVDKVNPVPMLYLDNSAMTGLPQGVTNVIRSCLEISLNNRPNIGSLLEMLAACKDEWNSNRHKTLRRSTYNYTPGHVFKMAREH